MSTRSRIVTLVVLVVVMVGGLAAYLLNARADNELPPSPLGAVSFDETDTIVVRDLRAGAEHDHLAQLRLTDLDTRAVAEQVCARVSAVRGHGVCLATSHDAPGQFDVVVLDADVKPMTSYPLVGVPSRARISPSGRMFDWTVFVTGDSYNGGRFSTRSGIYDQGANELVGTLEDWKMTVDGESYRSADVNVWGITWVDDNAFYATLATRGHHYLVKGDFAARTLETLRSNVECPSLSPDGTRVAYKLRVPDESSKTWRFAVLDLETMEETLLAETRSVDDQAAWFDDDTVMYGVPRGGPGQADVWSVPADGSGEPSILVKDADSPAVIR